jgi:arylsulfatase
VYGELGSPSATTTISGKQIPPTPPKFGGVIKEKASESTRWWPPRVVPPKGTPNVLLIMTDDVGFGAPGTFGGVIPTSTMDRIAREGLRCTNFHSTSLRSRFSAARFEVQIALRLTSAHQFDNDPCGRLDQQLRWNF